MKYFSFNELLCCLSFTCFVAMPIRLFYFKDTLYISLSCSFITFLTIIILFVTLNYTKEKLNIGVN